MKEKGESMLIKVSDLIVGQAVANAAGHVANVVRIDRKAQCSRIEFDDGMHVVINNDGHVRKA
jgi:sRNA-binding protein